MREREEVKLSWNGIVGDPVQQGETGSVEVLGETGSTSFRSIENSSVNGCGKRKKWERS